MADEERIVAPQEAPGEASEHALRPTSLEEFVGQQGVRENLGVFIQAASSRAEAMDHTLFYGPPG